MRQFFLLLVLFIANTSFAQTQFSPQQVDVDKETMLEYQALVKTIMKEQERILRIKFPQGVPVLSVQFGLPDRVPSTYSASEKTLAINAIYAHCDFVFLRKNIRQPSFDRTDCYYEGIRQSISHALGYFYLQTVLLESKPSSWLADTLSDGGMAYYDFNQFANLMTIRGIAESFEDTFGDRTDAKVSQGIWWTPSTAANHRAYAYSYGEMQDPRASQWFLSQGAHDIIRPILEARGFQNGIQWLLENSFSIQLLGHPPDDLVDWGPVLEYRTLGVNTG